MRMTRQDLPKPAAGSAELVQELCNKAHTEGRKDMAVKLSGRLDHLACHASNCGLSAAEVIDLIRQESEAIDPKGGALWQ